MTPAAPAPSFFDTPDGLTHAWYELGDPAAPGPVIVLQHGFSATTATEWVEPGIARAIAGLGRRVIGLDAVGHGQSTRSHDSAHYGEARMGRDVSALLDTLGIGRFDFLGYSMGAIIGLQVAVTDPRLNRLVMGGIGEGVIACGGVDTRVLSRTELAAGLRAADASGFSAMVRAFRAGIVARGGDLIALAAHADAGQPPAPDLGSIAVPSLLIAGDADPLAIRPEILAAAIPGCRLVTVPGDHVQARLDPGFTAAVLAFLA